MRKPLRVRVREFTDEQLMRSFRAARAVHRTPREKAVGEWSGQLYWYKAEFKMRGLKMPKK